MKISVVIATYQGEQFLAEQLDTIRTQTLPPDEVVIVDDVSQDNTVQVAKDYIAKYNLSDSWKVYVNEENMGYANNFNKATSLATGDLIFFSDQDDIWREDKIQIMTDIMAEHPECMVLCTDYNPWYFGETDHSAPQSVLDKMPNNGVLEKITLSKKSVYIGAIGCCMCVRKSFYSSIEDYWFDGWAQDDRMWKLSQCVDGCLLLHSNLISHRIHSNNTSTYGKYHTVGRRVKLFNEMRLAEEQMLRMLETQNGGAPSKKIIRKHIEMMKYRIDLLENRHLLKCVPLVTYLGYYEKVKSFLLEAYMALKKH